MMMSDERRYWFVIDKGKLEYVQDNVTNEKITVSELEDLLNELIEENEQLRQKLDFYLLDEFEWKEKYGDCDLNE